MSFQEAKRDSIKRYMLEKIREDDVAFVQKTAENFQVSGTTVKRYIKKCLEDGVLKEKEGGCGYALESVEYCYQYELTDGIAEDKIFFQDIQRHFEDISNEAKSIWSYAFMEMMNNAIEHSEGKSISCKVKKDCLYTEISIADDGVGIFENIKKYLKEQGYTDNTNHDAVLELYKGKLTTNANFHSGEGIFFTSKMLNEFAIWSDNTYFSVGCNEKEKFVESYLIAYYTKLLRIGTLVVMKLDNYTDRKAVEIFDQYAPDGEGVSVTRIPVKEVCPYGEPIARSQARRILYRLEQFSKVEMDFEKIEFMGQGFADEIFRVYQNKHPEVELSVLNASLIVQRMIQHVKR